VMNQMCALLCGPGRDRHRSFMAADDADFFQATFGGKVIQR
jgi:hypothetical protein